MESRAQMFDWGGVGSAIKGAPLPPNTHNSLSITGSNMSRYAEIEAYVLEQIRREQVFLDAANWRMRHCLAIVSAIDPTRLDRLQHWLWIVDWAFIEIHNSEAVIRLWWARLYCLYKANQLVEF